MQHPALLQPKGLLWPGRKVLGTKEEAQLVLLVMGMNVTFEEAARPYIERGWRVFPMTRDKRPLIKDWYKAATRDPEIIRSWSKQFPDANIAVATGAASGITVLDIDGEEGLNNLHRLGCKVPIPDAPTVKSARGWHLYFRHAGRTPSGRLAPGIDVRANSASITAPPSIHKSGHEYVWVKPLDKLPSLPLGLFLDLYKPKVILYQRPVTSINIQDLVDRVASAPMGERNNTLNIAAYQAGRLIREGLISYSEAWDSLYRAALACGLEKLEIRDTLRSGLKAGQTR